MPSAAEQLAQNFNFSAFSKATELKNRILFTMLALIVARLGTYIPMPGIDGAELARQIQQQQGGLLDVFNLLAGGAIQRMAIFALGIMPYISSSIIIQLMTTSRPRWSSSKRKARPAASRSISTPATARSCSPRFRLTPSPWASSNGV